MKKEAKVGRAVRYIGIGVAAKALQVTDHHLRLVLNGERTSPPLMAKVRKMFPALLGS